MIAKLTAHHKAGLFLFAIFLFLSPGNSAAKSVLIKIATLAPEGSAWMQTFNELKSEILNKTDKTVRFRIYPGGVLGDEKDVLRKIRIGQLHAG